MLKNNVKSKDFTYNKTALVNGNISSKQKQSATLAFHSNLSSHPLNPKFVKFPTKSPASKNSNALSKGNVSTKNASQVLEKSQYLIIPKSEHQIKREVKEKEDDLISEKYKKELPRSSAYLNELNLTGTSLLFSETGFLYHKYFEEVEVYDKPLKILEAYFWEQKQAISHHINKHKEVFQNFIEKSEPKRQFEHDAKGGTEVFDLIISIVAFATAQMNYLDLIRARDILIQQFSIDFEEMEEENILLKSILIKHRYKFADEFGPTGLDGFFKKKKNRGINLPGFNASSCVPILKYTANKYTQSDIDIVNTNNDLKDVITTVTVPATEPKESSINKNLQSNEEKLDFLPNNKNSAKIFLQKPRPLEKMQSNKVTTEKFLQKVQFADEVTSHSKENFLDIQENSPPLTAVTEIEENHTESLKNSTALILKTFEDKNSGEDKPVPIFESTFVQTEEDFETLKNLTLNNSLNASLKSSTNYLSQKLETNSKTRSKADLDTSKKSNVVISISKAKLEKELDFNTQKDLEKEFLEKEVVKLKEKLKEKENENKTRLEELELETTSRYEATLKAEKEKSQIELTFVKEKFDAMLKDQENELNNQIKTLKLEIENLLKLKEVEIMSLSQKLLDTKEEGDKINTLLQEKLNTTMEKFNKSLEDCNLLKEKLHLSEELVRKLKIEIEELEKKIKALEETNETNLKDFEDLRVFSVEVQQEVKYYEKVVDEKNGKITELEKKLDDLREQSVNDNDREKKLNSLLENSRKRSLQLGEEVSDLSMKVQEYEAEKRTVDSVINELKASLDILLKYPGVVNAADFPNLHTYDKSLQDAIKRNSVIIAFHEEKNHNLREQRLQAAIDLAEEEEEEQRPMVEVISNKSKPVAHNFQPLQPQQQMLPLTSQFLTEAGVQKMYHLSKFKSKTHFPPDEIKHFDYPFPISHLTDASEFAKEKLPTNKLNRTSKVRVWKLSESLTPLIVPGVNIRKVWGDS
ncbi:hypothetical protein HDU92_007849 [Lobulomyces angularis]|nr:hypothetical protein HDU92_007849 [Lobulomyces angularis]